MKIIFCGTTCAQHTQHKYTRRYRSSKSYPPSPTHPMAAMCAALRTGTRALDGGH